MRTKHLENFNRKEFEFTLDFIQFFASEKLSAVDNKQRKWCYVIRQRSTYHRLGILAENMLNGVQCGHNTLIAGDFSIFHRHIEINAENL